MSTRIIIPAYEPDERMVALVAELHAAAADSDVIVVDDGSGFAFEPLFSEAKRSGAHVLSYRDNHGKGYAIKFALSYLTPHILPSDIVVVMDCDGQHAVSDALRLAKISAEHPEALILGCRLQSPTSPLRSRLGNAITRGVFRTVTGVRVYDTQTGLRAFTGRLLPTLREIPGSRYEYETNVLLTCTNKGITLMEEPIQTIYIDNNRASHFHTLRDSWLIYKEILKFAASSFTSFLLDYILYSVILLLGGAGSVLAANIAARLVSATVNYSINRNMVFESDTPVAQSALRYAALAFGILVVNSALLMLLTSVLGLNAFIAKVAVEAVMFVLSYLVQKRMVFRAKPRTLKEQ